MGKKFDFRGWATKANLKCSDGRVITDAAFKHCDGMTVPMVWGHQHDDPQRVLGHCLLEYRPGGMYTYGKFNDTEQGQNAKLLVEHGDVKALSIYANQLRQDGPNVLHGAIREVSLVLAGANPGAFIEEVMMHSDDAEPVIDPTKAIIYAGEEIELCHEDDDGEAVTTEGVVTEETPATETQTEEIQHAEGDDKKDKENETESDEKKTGKTVKEVWEGIQKKLDEDEMNLIYGMVGAASAVPSNIL